MAKNVLFSKRSPYQLVELLKHKGGLMLRLNGNPQVQTTEEKLYHEAFTTLPMMLAEKVTNVVILGGGDGLSAREVLRFPGVKKVTLVELDPVVIELCRDNPEWRTITGGALSDPRLNVVGGDALQWMIETKEKFDVIVHDIEDNFTEQPKPLTVEFYYAFYQALFKKLKPGGVWVTLIANDEDDMMLNAMYAFYEEGLSPEVKRKFKRKRGVPAKTRVLLETLFPHVTQWTVKLPVLGTATVLYMSKAPMDTLRRPAPEGSRFVGVDVLKKLT
jgi:spermidine synthase